VPQSDAAQEIEASRFSTFPLRVEPRIEAEPVFGNRFAYFEFHEPQGAQIIRHQFTATVWNQQWVVNAASVVDLDKWPDSFRPYLKPQSLDDETQFQSILRQIVPERRGPGADLASVMNWIDANLRYDHVNASLRADANHAIAERCGHCSDYHGLCATMGRMLGFPTRVAYGWALFPKNSPSHCKMEAYLPPYGWVSFDLSETQKMVRKLRASDELSESEKTAPADTARKRLLAGFRENSWLLMTKGTDYELVPKASRPVRVVRTAYIEADGEPLPDPDPANIEKREFAWMTVHQFHSDKPFKLPFEDISTLSVD
jgi:transglutaminase-like putative cysteine protease